MTVVQPNCHTFHPTLETVLMGPKLQSYMEPLNQSVTPLPFGLKKNKRLPIEQEKAAFNSYKDQLFQWKSPPLSYKPGTKGYILTCRLDVPCLANLLYLVGTSPALAPIELWMTREELETANQKLLTTLVSNQVTIKVFDDYIAQYTEYIGPLYKHRKANYHYKLLALVMTQFQHVILLDRDFYLLQKPEMALNSLIQSGANAAFWHDMVGISAQNPIWDLVGISPIAGYAQDSCFVYINKETAWRGLYLAAYMNQKQNVYYQLVHGDKDTFFIAFESLGINYTWAPYAPYLLCKSSQKTATDVRSHQPDLTGQPLGVHLGVFTCAQSKDPNFIKYLWTYDANKHYVKINKNGSRSVVPFEQGKDTSTVVPSEAYIGSFAKVISQDICLAELLLS